MYTIKIHRLILCAALIALCVSSASAQSDAATAQKRAAIRELLEVTGMTRYSSAAFRDFVTRYQQNWANSVVEDFKAKGLFDKFTPEEAAKMEGLIHQFGDRVFDEIKRRMIEEVATPDSLIALAEPAFDRHFTSDEIDRWLTFSKSPLGRKLTDRYYQALSEAAASMLEAKGAFDVKPSPEAELAKNERLKKEMQSMGPQEIRQLLDSAKISPDYFTPQERQELAAFYQAPLGRKIIAETPQVLAEIVTEHTKLLGPRVNQLSKEIFNQQIEWLGQQVHDLLKNHDAQQRGKPARAQ